MVASETGADRAFVLGLDGVPWRLIERWSDDGTLPNFARLRERGASGPLESTRPPTTPLAWPSIATGVWPDKHGIYGFQNLASNYTHRMYTNRDLKAATLWDVLTPAIVGNVPMTYPPPAVDGAVVSGMMTPGTDRTYTSPPELADEIEAKIPDYQIGLDYPAYADDLEAFDGAVADILERRRELLRLLLDRVDDWRCCFFVFTAPDRFQHLVWEESRLREHYRELDDLLGEVMATVDDVDGDLYVVSDHGFGPIDTLVYVNRILEQEGYLTRSEDSGARGALSSLGITRDVVTEMLGRIGISERRLTMSLPTRLVHSVAEQLPGEHALYDVDYHETRVFAHDAGNIYVNDTDRFDHGTVSPSKVEEIKREVEIILKNVTAPDSDEPVLEVFDGDDLFASDENSPDLVVNGRDRYETRNAIRDEAFGDPGATVASHRPSGIICCAGPSIAPDERIEGARVVDVAPTLLHSLGEPVPAEADGRVLFDAFASDSRPATSRVLRQHLARDTDDEDGDEDFSDVEDRLKGLGYME